MTDFDDDEEVAILKGGAAGAEYLSSINQFRLDMLSPDQALTFLKCVIGNYHEALVERETGRHL